MNCRNTRRIHKFSMQFLDADIESSNLVPEGIAPERHSARSDDDQRDRCGTILTAWKLQYRLTPDRIAILSPVRRQRSCLAEHAKISGFPIVDSAADWRNGKGLLFSTITAFKGLEADAVIILAAEQAACETDISNYVATSRAKHLLAMIHLNTVKVVGKP
ncbi:MAG: ATP-binding domain-containing protein [Planctomycetaceae bacterium]